MLIEALRPLRIRLPEGEIRLDPGYPVDFPAARARKLLSKACGRVRAVAPIPSGACWACGRIRYWLSVYDHMVCGVCHPPADPALVLEWIEGSP